MQHGTTMKISSSAFFKIRDFFRSKHVAVQLETVLLNKDKCVGTDIDCTRTYTYFGHTTGCHK
jgi:hypothetical protein